MQTAKVQRAATAVRQGCRESSTLSGGGIESLDILYFHSVASRMDRRPADGLHRPTRTKRPKTLRKNCSVSALGLYVGTKVRKKRELTARRPKIPTKPAQISLRAGILEYSALHTRVFGLVHCSIRAKPQQYSGPNTAVFGPNTPNDRTRRNFLPDTIIRETSSGHKKTAHTSVRSAVTGGGCGRMRSQMIEYYCISTTRRGVVPKSVHCQLYQIEESTYRLRSSVSLYTLSNSNASRS